MSLWLRHGRVQIRMHNTPGTFVVLIQSEEGIRGFANGFIQFNQAACRNEFLPDTGLLDHSRATSSASPKLGQANIL